ncbi:MAG: hypothetical protein CMD26_01520 [Flavobacteriales bacterium]|nr:hypothetical protein [Flavobacteriales bacterium]
MINKILISNYAIIDHLEVDFSPGFTIITGETGAGKSIILGALNLLLGNRFDSINFKEKSKKAIIEGIFNISHLNLQLFFQDHNLDYDDSLIIRREFSADGKSRSFVNDSPVKLDLLKKIGVYLVDIHSQHENLLINNDQFQINLIDQYAIKNFPAFKTIKKSYSDLFQDFIIVNNRIQSIEKLLNQSIDLEYKKKIIDTINKLNLVVGEKSKLESQYNKIKNIHKIKEFFSEIILLLDDTETSILTQLNLVSSKLLELTQYDSKLQDLLVRIKQNEIDLRDINMEFHSLNQELSINSENMESIEDRINSINSLEKELNVFSIKEILNKRDSWSNEIISLGKISNEIEMLQSEKKSIHTQMSDLSIQINSIRNQAASKLTHKIENDLFQIGIKNPSIKFEITRGDQFFFNGSDNISILFSSNKGYALKPLGQIASGGEIARLMLCLKKQLFSINTFSTIIFDEIDSGVSGEIGRKMGRILQNIAINGQVICITHLPQIASIGKYHYRVSKIDNDDSSQTIISEIMSHDRVLEIARMLSGDEVNDEAIANAKKMLDI